MTDPRPFAWPDNPPEEASDLPEFGPGSIAPIRPRAIARVIDSLLVGTVIVVAVVAGSETDANDETTFAGWSIAVALGFWYLYETLPVGTRGQTLGMRVTGIQVVDRETGIPPVLYRAGLRVLVVMGVFIIVSLATSPLGVGNLGPASVVFLYGSAVAGGTLRRNVPDRVAKTLVVSLR